MATRSETDRVMKKAQRLFDESGKSLEQLGLDMGYGEGVARRAAWQFLNRTNDPRLSMLRRFAQAMGIELTELL
jgi:transcriptional regulator with XRE-family HTH domain